MRAERRRPPVRRTAFQKLDRAVRKDQEVQGKVARVWIEVVAGFVAWMVRDAIVLV